MAVAGLVLGAAAVGAGVFYLLESPTSPVPYATSRETPHEAGPMKGVLQGIPDIFWPENKNPFVEPRPAEGVPGDYYKEKDQWGQYPIGQFGVAATPQVAAASGEPLFGRVPEPFQNYPERPAESRAPPASRKSQMSPSPFTTVSPPRSQNRDSPTRSIRNSPPVS